MSRPAEYRLQTFRDDAQQEFAQRWATEARRRDLVVGPRRVRLAFGSDALAEALLPALLSRIEEPAGEPDVEMRLWESTTPLPWRDHDLAARGLLRGGQDDPVTIVHESGSTAVTVVASPPEEILYRVESAQALPWWERAAPLRPALSFALSSPDRALVHAGAVGNDRGGVLLGGPGGSGKTTTALAALDAGWRYVGDDYVLVDLGGTGPLARNLFGTAKLDAGHCARFANLAALAGPPPEDPEEKSVLDVALGRPGAVAAELELHAVVIPRITGGRSRHWPMGGAEALLALAPSTVFQMPYDEGQVVRLISRLVRRVPCFALGVGDDPGDLAGVLDDLLDRVA